MSFFKSYPRFFIITGLVLIGLTILFIREYQLVAKQGVNSWKEDLVADCAVVLTGGPNRTVEGLDLLYQKSVKKLILSGVFPHSELRDIYPQLSFMAGINSEDIILEKRSLTTFGNAMQSLPLVQALKCKDVLLVTSQVHMYRSLRTFKKHYPQSIRLLAFATVGSGYRPSFSDLSQETLKSMFYRFWAY